MSSNPTIKIFAGPQLVHEQPLTASELTLGRAPECDVVLAAPTVSRRHARLFQAADGWRVENLSTTAPARLNGAPLAAPAPLGPDDRLEIGPLVVQLGLAASRPARAVARFTPAQPVVTIGRAPDNTIVLDYPDVSARHARISWQAGGALLEDLGSTNGTFARGRRVSSLVLGPGESIQIASHQLVVAADTVQAPASEQVRLEAVGLRAVAQGGTLVLLDDISLAIAPRELVAVVGGSGAGKSTLIEALSGVRPADQGRVLVNGQDFYGVYGAYSRSLGFVPQEDLIYRDLTVERSLRYAAELRLPPDTTPAEIERRIAEVLDDVQLTAVRDREVSKLSGGQRKRVSIAVELLARPALFFLDEPTTGLDPGLDRRMMTLLRRLADRGRTVVLVTHATANIAVCDKVAFLARGRLCFFGPPNEALAFFGAASFAEIYSLLDQSPAGAAEWQRRFAASPWHQAVALQASPANLAAAQGSRQASRPPRADGWRQLRVLTARHAERLTRDRAGLLAALLPAPLISLLLALFVPGGMFAAGASPLDAQRVLFLLVIAAVLLGATGATRELVKERAIYRRERLVNLRIAPYLGGKLAVLGLLALAQSVLLLSVVIWPMGLRPWGALFPTALELLVGLWLAALGGVGLGLLCSAVAATVEQAVSLLPLLMLAQILLAGLVFPLPEALRPLSYATVSRWGIDSLGTSADLNRLYYLRLPAAPPGVRPATLFTPTTFDPASYDAAAARDAYTPAAHQASRRANLARSWGAQLAQTLLFLTLAGALLRRGDRH